MERTTRRSLKLLALCLFCLTFSLSKVGAQTGCTLDFMNDTVSVNCGDSVTLEMTDKSTQLGDNFNDSSLASGWSSNQTVNFKNPCNPSVDSTPYAWMGPAATQPRNLTTGQMNVQCGGNICFDLKFAEQSNSAPCEGPDLPDEGVHLQYSTNNGATWTDIYYFNPDTACCGCGGACGGNPPSPFLNWDNYCFPVPGAAQTPTTKFRWYQKAGSDADFDHWGIDNVKISGSTCDSIVSYSYDSTTYDTTKTKKVAPLTNTTYKGWGITDTSGASSDTCSATVHVNVNGVPDLNVTATPDSIQCNDSTALNAGHSVSGAITYKWSPNYNITDTTVQSPSAWPAIDTTYQVIAHQTGSPKCSDTSSVDVGVNSDTCITPLPTRFSPSCKNGSDGMISAELRGCRAPFKITWRDSTGAVVAQDSPVTGIDTLSGLVNGVYTITTTDTMGCTKDTTVKLTEPDRIKASVSNDTLICKGGNAKINGSASGGNAPPYSYDWNNGLPDTTHHQVSPGNTTEYILQSKDSLGCISKPDTVRVEVNPSLFVSATPSDTICPGGVAKLSTLTTTGGYGSGYSYTWVSAAGDTVGTGKTVSVKPSTSMNYIVHVEDNCETPKDQDTTQVAIFPGYSGADVQMAVSDTAGCHPFTVDFTSLTPSNKTQSTFWTFGDGTSSNDSGTTQHTYNDIGCYDVNLEVTSKNGCVEDSTFEEIVCARPYPNANFVMQPNDGTVLKPRILFADRSSGAEEYQWSFEHTDSTSALPTLEMRFPDDDPGSYDVEQKVINQYGCADSITKLAKIEGKHQVFIPNAFTPDGDGKNDIFRPKGEGIATEKYHLRIYDRWGKLMFESKKPEQGWDGKVNGEPVPSGIYVYEVRVKNDYTGRVRTRRGHLNLLGRE